MISRLKSENADLLKQIAEGEWGDEVEGALGAAIAEALDDFGPDFDAEGNPLEEGESDRIKSEEERAKPGRTAEASDDSADDSSDSAEDDSGDSEESGDEEEAATTA